MRIKYDIFSKYRTPLMGLAAIMIMLFHTTAASDFSKLGIIGKIFAYGNAGVDIFLFLSGIGCFFSLHKLPDEKTFYVKRAYNILPVSAIIIGLFCIAEIVLGIKGTGRALLDVFCLGSDNPAWFIPFILLLYLAYPWLVKLLKSRWGEYWLLIIASVSIFLSFTLCSIHEDMFRSVEASLTRVPVFLLGTFCGKRIIYKSPVKILWIAIPSSAVLWVLRKMFHNGFENVFYRYMGSCIGISISLLFVVIMFFLEHKCQSVHRRLDQAFSFFGAMSLETYLTHNLIKSLFEAKNLLTLKMYFFIVAGSVILSIPLARMRKNITLKAKR